MPDPLKTLKIMRVVVDPEFQARVKGLDDGHVAELRDAYAAGKDVPPGRVFRLDGKYVLTRGHHRLAGARAAGLEELPFEVREGTREDARLDAAASNASHGLKRTNEDKRRAVLWTIAVRSGWSNTKIADWCGVASTFVDDLRAEVAALTAAKTASANDCKSNIGDSVKQNLISESDDNKTDGPTVTKPPTKADHSATAGKLLTADPARSDAGIAKEIGCKPAVVAKARKVLVKAGLIPAPAKQPEPPAGDPEPSPPTEPAAGESAAEPEPAPADAASPAGDEGAAFVRDVETICRDLDRVAVRMKSLKESRFSYPIHVDSAVSQVEAARKTLWQGRPCKPCPYCGSAGCDQCRGTGRMKPATFDAATKAMGGAA